MTIPKPVLVGGISTSLVAAIAAFLIPFEGIPTQKQPDGTVMAVAYKDPANPKIATICHGETKDVKLGDKKTLKECDEMLLKRIPEFIAAVDRIMPNLPENRRMIYAEVAYNLGAGILTRQSCEIKGEKGKCLKYKSGTSIKELEKAGQYPKACARLLLFDHAGGVKMKGLTKRRQAEYKICMGET